MTDADLDPTTLPAYLDVIVADDEGALRILGTGDTPGEAMQALREVLEQGAGSIPVHAVYHSFGITAGTDFERLRYLIASDPTASSFYTLGRQDERVRGSDELRELGDERVRRAALERTLTEVRAAVESIADETNADIPYDPGNATAKLISQHLRSDVLDLIGDVLPPALDSEPQQ